MEQPNNPLLDPVVYATAAGVIVTLVGLWISVDAYRTTKARESAATKTRGGQTGPETLGGIDADVVKILPELVKTAAGVAVAVLLIGALMLVGGGVASNVGEGASPSPTATQ